MTFKSKVVTTLKVLGIAAATAFMVKMTTPNLYAQEMAELSRPKVEAQKSAWSSEKRFEISLFGRIGKISGVSQFATDKDFDAGYGTGVAAGYQDNVYITDHSLLEWALNLGVLPYNTGKDRLKLRLRDREYHSTLYWTWFDSGRASISVSPTFGRTAKMFFSAVVEREMSQMVWLAAGIEMGMEIKPDGNRPRTGDPDLAFLSLKLGGQGTFEQSIARYYMQMNAGMSLLNLELFMATQNDLDRKLGSVGETRARVELILPNGVLTSETVDFLLFIEYKNVFGRHSILYIPDIGVSSVDFGIRGTF